MDPENNSKQHSPHDQINPHEQRTTLSIPAQREAFADTSRPEDDELSQLKLKVDQSNLVSNLLALQCKADRSAQVQQT